MHNVSSFEKRCHDENMHFEHCSGEIAAQTYNMLNIL